MTVIKTPLGDWSSSRPRVASGASSSSTTRPCTQIIEGEETTDDASLAAELQRQLDAYFAGTLQEFDLPLDPQGTEFQRRAWDVIANIPCGETISYGTVAMLGRRAGRLPRRRVRVRAQPDRPAGAVSPRRGQRRRHRRLRRRDAPQALAAGARGLAGAVEDARAAAAAAAGLGGENG